MKKFLLIFVFSPSLALASSAEERCFENLLEQAKTTVSFSDLDLTQLQKINGGFKSEPFSLAYYSKSHLASAMQSDLESLEAAAQSAENRAKSSAGIASDRAQEAASAERAFEEASAEAEAARKDWKALSQDDSAETAEIELARSDYEAASESASAAQTEKERKIQESEQAQKTASDDALEAEKARKAVDDFLESLEESLQFQEIAGLDLPSQVRDVKYFPKELNRVSNQNLIPGTSKYKANRTNIGTVMFQNSIETNLGDVDEDGDNDYIKGYFVDSQVVTFGRKLPNFSFPFRSRDPNSSRPWAFGKPYSDLREYMVYTHHLAPAFGGQFLSCGLVKIEPDGVRDLEDLKTGDYDGNDFQGSSYSIEVLPKSPEGHEFRKGIVAIQSFDKSSPALPFARFQVLTLAYNNASNFLNEFTTLELQTEAMTTPPNQAEGMNQTIEIFYKLIEDQTDLMIVGGLSDYQPEDGSAFRSSSLLASVFEKEPNPMQGGIALHEGTPFEVLQSIKLVEDPSLQAYLRMSVTPGYNEIYARKPEDQRTAFEKRFLGCDLTGEQKLENVKFLLQNQGSVNLQPNNLEYKNLRFGDCAIPFQDTRKLKILQNNPFTLQALLDKYDDKRKVFSQEIEDLKLAGKLNSAAVKRINAALAQLEADYQSEKSSYIEAQKLYSRCQVDFLRHEIGDIFAGENLGNIRQKCEDEFAVLMQKIPEFSEKVEKFSGLDRSLFPKEPDQDKQAEDSLIGENNLDNTDAVSEFEEGAWQSWAQSRFIYFLLAVGTFIIAAGVFSLIFLFGRAKK